MSAAGTVLGLLGPDGAGRTTTVRVLTTLPRPDAGSGRWPWIVGTTAVLSTLAVRTYRTVS